MVEWSELKSRVTFVSRPVVLELAVRLARPVAGSIVEFGVFDGGSTRVLRDSLDRCEREDPRGMPTRIYACDSFKGLLEPFERLEVGAFACDPPVIPGVEIVEGYFADSLTPELARRVGPVALASLDADLYSSTLCALRWLTPLLHRGSLLLFDEFLGEQASEERAFEDWRRETGTPVIQIAEFPRDPSGHGSRVDKRVLWQVLEDRRTDR